jgi:hypothetical protein
MNYRNIVMIKTIHILFQNHELINKVNNLFIIKYIDSLIHEAKIHVQIFIQ